MGDDDGPAPSAVRWRVLLVAGDPAYRSGLAGALIAAGLDVLACRGMACLAVAVQQDRPALAMLDLGAAAPEGIVLLRRLDRPALPVMVLDEGGDEDRIALLELGADEVISRYARPREIVARARALARRAGIPGWNATPGAAWQVRQERRDVRRPDGTCVTLTTAEFGLLGTLMRRQGEPVSRETLFEEVFGRSFNPLDRAVDNVVAKLRAKLDDGGHGVIRTVRPIGYEFVGFPPGS